MPVPLVPHSLDTPGRRPHEALVTPPHTLIHTHTHTHTDTHTDTHMRTLGLL
jgi:hypothetical protein